MKSILITGASGFIGSFIVEKALEIGFEVWAGVRKTSSKAYLQDERIHFCELNLGDKEILKKQIQHQHAEGWDYVIHAAGATKGKNEDAFMKTNYEGTVNLVEALRENGILPQRMAYLSSLSVLGGIRQKKSKNAAPYVYEEIEEYDEAKPNTAYGKSKWKTEQYLTNQQDLDVVTLRPTGVYGPREKDYFMMAKSISQHIDFAVGFQPQEITFVYVKDLVEAIFIALKNGENGRCYFVSDGKTYNSKDFSLLLQNELQVSKVLHITAPLLVLRLICALSSALSSITGKMNALNNDKYNILKQRNWRCDICAIEAIGYKPQYDLRRGVEESIAWYKKEGWI